jgi:hypothetical protein
MKRTPYLLLAAAAALAGTPAFASSFDINNLQNLAQPEFHVLAQDLGAALSYKPLEPADPLGITGFDIGLAMTATSLKDTATVQKAIGSGTVYNSLPVPTLRMAKGLPFDIDLGLLYSKVPSSNISLTGAEIRWAAMAGNVALPAVSVRLAATSLSGVTQLSQRTQSLDVSVSKGILLFKPYIGVGEVWSQSTPHGVPALSEEKLTQSKVFAGLNMNFGLFNIALEGDRTGSVSSYGAKFGFRF